MTKSPGERRITIETDAKPSFKKVVFCPELESSDSGVEILTGDDRPYNLIASEYVRNYFQVRPDDHPVKVRILISDEKWLDFLVAAEVRYVVYGSSENL